MSEVEELEKVDESLFEKSMAGAVEQSGCVRFPKYLIQKLRCTVLKCQLPYHREAEYIEVLTTARIHNQPCVHICNPYNQPCIHIRNPYNQPC